MQLYIKKSIDSPQQHGHTPTRLENFIDITNQFNPISCKESFNIIATSFPKMLSLEQLFYEKPYNVHFKWDDGSWHTLLMHEGSSQGCPLSPLFYAFIVARLLEPIDDLLKECATPQLAHDQPPGEDGCGGVTNLLVGGPAHSFRPIIFCLSGNAFFLNLLFAKLGWEFQFWVPISGTPIGSGIPIPFSIPKIPVGIFFEFRCLKIEKSEFRFRNSEF
jgi:hypothetical protein